MRCPSRKHCQSTLPETFSERLPNYSRKIGAQIMQRTPGLFHAVWVSLAERWINAARILSGMLLCHPGINLAECHWQLQKYPSSKLNFMAFFLSWGQYLQDHAWISCKWLPLLTGFLAGVATLEKRCACTLLLRMRESTVLTWESSRNKLSNYCEGPTNLQRHAFPSHILHLCGLKVGESHPAKQIRVQVAATKRGHSFRLVSY